MGLSVSEREAFRKTVKNGRKTKLKRLTNNRTGVSQRRLAIKFNVHQTTVGRQLTIMDISYRKREKTPKYSAVLHEKAKKFSKKLSNMLYGSPCSLILDDEKYFTLVGDNIMISDKESKSCEQCGVQMRKRRYWTCPNKCVKKIKQLVPH